MKRVNKRFIKVIAEKCRHIFTSEFDSFKVAMSFFCPSLIFVSVEELDDSSDPGSDFESTQKGKRWRKWSRAQHPVMYTVLHLFLLDL